MMTLKCAYLVKKQHNRYKDLLKDKRKRAYILKQKNNQNENIDNCKK